MILHDFTAIALLRVMAGTMESGNQVDPHQKHEEAIEEVNDEDEIDECSDEMIPSHGDLNLGLGPLTFAEEGEEEEVLTQDMTIDLRE